MQYTAIAETDIGTSRTTNQDSVIIKHARYTAGEVLMAIVCDGMGGLSKGELASATVIREFSHWFDEQLPIELNSPDLTVIGGKWSHMLKDLNLKILSHAKKNNAKSMGTTFSGILFINDEYVIAHVGDSRIYQIGEILKQITNDHTFIAREIKRGTLTPEQAKTDKRRNLLLQCIGASDVVEPEITFGKAEKGAYMICSDGFRHVITESEMADSLNPSKLTEKKIMRSNTRELIETVKNRGEKDNISVVLIKAE